MRAEIEKERGDTEDTEDRERWQEKIKITISEVGEKEVG